MKKILYKLMYFLPKNHISYVFGNLVSLKRPWVLSVVIKEFFISAFNINMDEAEHPKDHYKSFGEVFTRKLKPGIRPIGEGIIHPADSYLSQFGKLSVFDTRALGTDVVTIPLIQAKGIQYYIEEFLKDKKSINTFADGTFMTYYLCPTDYHRVHFSYGGNVKKCVHIPGNLWPVNDFFVNNMVDLFSKNERTITWMETDKGPMCLVMVGATNVGKMTMAFDDNIVTNQKLIDKVSNDFLYDDPIGVKKGDELGTFNMGSTIVAIYSKGFDIDIAKLKEGPVKIGQSLY